MSVRLAEFNRTFFLFYGYEKRDNPQTIISQLSDNQQEKTIQKQLFLNILEIAIVSTQSSRTFAACSLTYCYTRKPHEGMRRKRTNFYPLVITQVESEMA